MENLMKDVNEYGPKRACYINGSSAVDLVEIVLAPTKLSVYGAGGGGFHQNRNSGILGETEKVSEQYLSTGLAIKFPLLYHNYLKNLKTKVLSEEEKNKVEEYEDIERGNLEKKLKNLKSKILEKNERNTLLSEIEFILQSIYNNKNGGKYSIINLKEYIKKASQISLNDMREINFKYKKEELTENSNEKNKKFREEKIYKLRKGRKILNNLNKRNAVLMGQWEEDNKIIEVYTFGGIWEGKSMYLARNYNIYTFDKEDGKLLKSSSIPSELPWYTKPFEISLNIITFSISNVVKDLIFFPSKKLLERKILNKAQKNWENKKKK